MQKNPKMRKTWHFGEWGLTEIGESAKTPKKMTKNSKNIKNI